MSYTLIIDGTYMAQRNRNAGGFTFQDKPERDRAELIDGLANSVAAEVRRFGGLINRVVWCLDYSSWRKSIKPTMPVESIKTEDESEYKANRQDDGSYNVQEFFSAVDEFTALLEKVGVCVIKQYKAEADDSAYVASRLLASKGFKSILWTSDGDYKTFVNEDVMLFKLPKREIFKAAEAPKSMSESVFGGNGKVDAVPKVVEAVGGDKNVKIINPIEYVFEQIVIGQSKDNIPPLFFWLKTTKRGIQTCKATWNRILKAFAKMNFDVADLTDEHLYNEAWIKRFIVEILDVCDQTRDIDHCYDVFVSSRKLAFVDKRELPDDVWQDCRKVLINEFKTKRLDMQKITSGSSIMSNSKSKSADQFFGQFEMNDIDL